MSKHQAKILGQVRHVIQAVGVYLVAEGYATEDMIQQIGGGAAAALMMVWSWKDPNKRLGQGD